MSMFNCSSAMRIGIVGDGHVKSIEEFNDVKAAEMVEKDLVYNLFLLYKIFFAGCQVPYYRFWGNCLDIYKF